MRTPSHPSPRIIPILLLLAAVGLLPALRVHAHGSLENGRMLQVRLAGPNGHAPAPWNDSYHTWNQNSQNFPGYANAGFSYAAAVPDGTLASAGINDGVQTGLNFSGLNNPGPGWTATPAAAGGAPVRLHFLSTAGHDPSHFAVYLTRAGINPDLRPLAWADLAFLGRWSAGDATRPYVKSTRPNPVTGGSGISYDFDVPVPADHGVLLVIWQREDPAGEAFFAVQDLAITPAATPQLTLSRSAGDGAVTLDLRGAVPGVTYVLESTDTLGAAGPWTPVGTGTADPAGRWRTVDPDAPGRSRRFYRASAGP